VIFSIVPILVAARYKAWICGRLNPGIMGSDSSGVVDVCLLWGSCVVK